MTISKCLVPALCALLFTGCGDDDINSGSYTPPNEYEFSSRNDEVLKSTVSNEIPVLHYLMLNELNEFMNNTNIIGLLSGIDALSRMNVIFKAGTTTSESGRSLSGYNIYTNSVITPTPINLQIDETLLQTNYSGLNLSTNIANFVSSDDRPLPFSTSIEIDVNGVPITTDVTNFVGWPVLDGVEDANEMPLKLLEAWLSEIGILLTDADTGNSTINNSGVHLDQLVNTFIQGSVFYSRMSQFNLVANKGLLKQNTSAFNIELVEEQLRNLEEKKASLEQLESIIEELEIKLDEQLATWLVADPDADPNLGIGYYNSLIQYGPLSLATAYFQSSTDLANRDANKVQREEAVVEAEESVDELLPYTDLANNWDEAFGYFGASRSYGIHTDSEIVTKTYDDVNTDGFIDAFTEVSYGYSVLASQRDADAELGNTDFSGNIWNAFLMGRKIIEVNKGRETVEFVGYHNDLTVQADIILENLEKVIAASIIHNINKTVSSIDDALLDGDLSEFDSLEFDYYQNWSSLKGMSSTLQFNDKPTITKENLIAVSDYIGDLPIVEGQNYAARKFDLEAARDIIRDTYGFAEANAAAW